MKESEFNRRKFIKFTASTATGISLLSAIPKNVLAAASLADETSSSKSKEIANTSADPRIRFSVIGINHGHIYSQVAAVTRGGGQLVSFYAKEPDLVAAFARRYPHARLARGEKEILEDDSVRLVLSAAIPSERAP